MSHGDIDRLVDRFVDEILHVLRRAKDEHHAVALAALSSMLPPPAAPVAPVAPAAPAAPPARVPAPRKAAASPPPEQAVAPRSSARAPGPPSPPRAPRARARGPETRRREDPRLGGPASEREASVIVALQSYPDGVKAHDLARHCGLPNGSVFVALRGLVASGRAVRLETQRGTEYKLVRGG